MCCDFVLIVWQKNVSKVPFIIVCPDGQKNKGNEIELLKYIRIHINIKIGTHKIRARGRRGRK